MADVTKYCVNCIHHKWVDPLGEYDRCVRQTKISLVTGKPEGWREAPYCSIERKVNGACGIEAFFFERDINGQKP